MGHHIKCLQSPHKVFCHTFINVYIIMPNGETMHDTTTYIEVQITIKTQDISGEI